LTLAERARALFAATLARLDPAERTAAALAPELAEAPSGAGRVVVVAVGKAAPAMARGAAAVLGERLAGGLVVAQEVAALPAELTFAPGAHPVPDAVSEAAGRALLATVSRGRPDQLVLALVSGGASALAAVPAPGLTLHHKRAAIAAVMAAGAPIGAINLVRKHLSAIKGGQLAAAALAPVWTLVASDVVGDDLATVGSGPTLPDTGTFAEAREVVRWASRVGRQVPAAVRRHLDAGVAGAVAETPKHARSGDRAWLVAGTRALIDAALAAGRAAGMAAETCLVDATSDVAEVARDLGRLARAAAGRARAAPGRPICLVGGGEPTVVLPTRPGRGGRAQQLALLCARELAGIPGVAVLCAGSDGSDGNTPAAGAVVDGATWSQVSAAGFDPQRALDGCDAHTALAPTGALITCGPTGVNHADLFLVLAES
jgi:glycerate-2-kinase